MRELFDGNVVVYERAEKILALSYHHVAVAARRNDSSYFRIGNGSVHLHYFLEWSVGTSHRGLLICASSG
jgi:hypothetical protein